MDGGVKVPLLYAIMESKERTDYEEVLCHLKDRLVGFGMDLEPPAGVGLSESCHSRRPHCVSAVCTPGLCIPSCFVMEQAA
ncbi:hypothetical protein Y032_0142g2289 [Ancylostoma ceylanicum]|uniref:Uncharacterized protein n=1 Tax=Ancylostoma ceylanicum TaxID=53326 RepID=A0A016T388_9BILA|nr:hypothetical protein Y032_0142g2289 [Ancylostoma ceylanicum]